MSSTVLSATDNRSLLIGPSSHRVLAPSPVTVFSGPVFAPLHVVRRSPSLCALGCTVLRQVLPEAHLGLLGVGSWVVVGLVPTPFTCLELSGVFLGFLPFVFLVGVVLFWG